MRTRRILGVATGALALTLVATAAHAHDDDYDADYDDDDRAYVFFEASGSYGMQLGETDYLPDGGPTAYRHPVVNGPAVGASIGVFVTKLIALSLNYEYTAAWTRSGEIPGVLDDVRGYIQYHTITFGPRLVVPAGFGRLRAEVGVGVVLPFDTQLEYEYAANLAAIGITGEGSRIDNYTIGFGAQGLVGYEFPLGDVVYLATDLKFKTLQSNNSDKTTELRNFVTDFEAVPPTATNATIEYQDGQARPTTNSVQSVRLQLSLGARF